MRRAYVAIGTCSVVTGFAVIVVPDAVPDGLLGVLGGLDRHAVWGVGLLALALALARSSRRLQFDGDHAQSRDTADRRTLPVPGSALDETLAEEDQAAVRKRLRGLAVESLVQRGSQRHDAERAVEEGSWTDDRVAAWFVGTDAPKPGLRYRLGETVRPGSGFERRVRRTVRAVESLHRGDRDA